MIQAAREYSNRAARQRTFVRRRVDAEGALHVVTKGFIVNFLDPQFAQMPVRFRGVHYCHFIAPDHLRDLLEGKASPGTMIGHKIVADPAAMPR